MYLDIGSALSLVRSDNPDFVAQVLSCMAVEIIRVSSCFHHNFSFSYFIIPSVIAAFYAFSILP